MNVMDRARWRGLVASLCLLLTVVLLLPQAGAVRASWSEDPSTNTPVCTARYNQHWPQIISDGSGGAIITWDDGRTEDLHTRIYAQRVGSGGTARWTENGLAICTASERRWPGWLWACLGTIPFAVLGSSGNQCLPQITSDGSGGAIIAWEDNRNGDYDIYAQRVDSSGAVQWSGNGVAVCTASGSQRGAQITSDTCGGAIIAWEDSRRGNWDIYAQRVDPTGAVQWADDGVIIGTAADGSYPYPGITSDGS